MIRITVDARAVALLLSGALVALAGAARAEDYPYSGAFAISGGTLAGDDLARTCALSFLEQRANGDWFVYHVDLERFRTDRTVRFWQVSNGHCDFDANRNVESCTTFIDIANPEFANEPLYDVVTTISAERVATVFFDDVAKLEASLADPALLRQGPSQNFDLCPVPMETLSQLVEPGMSPASPEVINALRTPDRSLLSDPLVALLVQRLQDM